MTVRCMEPSHKLYAGGIAIGIIIGIGAFVLFGDQLPTRSTIAPPISTAYATWKTVAPRTLFFAAKMPTDATHIHQDLQGPTSVVLAQDAYSANDEAGTTYFIIATTLPSTIPPTETDVLLHDALRGMVRQVTGNVLASAELTAYHGKRAIQFVIRNADEHTSFSGVMFFDAQMLYQVFVASTVDPAPQANIAYFLSAFTPRSP